ncbi:MAG: AraC family transcriptional regulator [Reinekea sp.]|nr:AraC family transcriptional regulator [Reinekea sp.]
MNLTTIADLVDSMVQDEGMSQNLLPFTSLYRVTEPQPLTPLVYDPSIYFVVQGEKEAWLREQRFVYNEFQYLVLTVPLPLRCRVFNAQPDKPFLAIRLDIDLTILAELVNQLPAQSMQADQSDSGIFVSESNEALAGSIHRLVSTAQQPEQAAVLAPMYYREILFHLLQGTQAHLLRNFVTQDRHNNRIAQVVHYIHRHYNHALKVEELADIAAMSPSTFHEHFKNVTHLSPLQYVKNIRLHHAKHQIFIEQLPVNEAAFNVGYESPSQFSREYKRLFGLSPVQHLRQSVI